LVAIILSPLQLH